MSKSYPTVVFTNTTPKSLQQLKNIVETSKRIPEKQLTPKTNTKKPRLSWSATPSKFFQVPTPIVLYDTVEAYAFASTTQQIKRLTEALLLKIQSIDMNLTILNLHPIDALYQIQCETTREANRLHLKNDFMTIYYLRSANDVQVDDANFKKNTEKYLLIQDCTLDLNK